MILVLNEKLSALLGQQINWPKIPLDVVIVTETFQAGIIEAIQQAQQAQQEHTVAQAVEMLRNGQPVSVRTGQRGRLTSALRHAGIFTRSRKDGQRIHFRPCEKRQFKSFYSGHAIDRILEG